MSEKIFPLRSPVQAYGDKVDQLKLKAPGVRCAREIGALPYVINQDEQVLLDLSVCAKYISRLAEIPLSAVDQIDIRDFNALAWEVARYFLDSGSPGSSSSSSMPSAPPTSGE